LRELDLSKNKISKIDQNSFPSPNQITLVKLEENHIKSLAMLETLGKL
jgi:Leucine-rich repeat (LRR) protein